MLKKEKRRNQVINELEKSGVMMSQAYEKKDIELELRAFQDKLVNLVFEQNHGKELRIADVQNHINELARSKGIDELELLEFNVRTEELKKMMAREISGNKGERMMKKTLRMLTKKDVYLCNVELSEDDFVTELDSIVVTPKVILIIESKQSSKDMCITKEGNYVTDDDNKEFKGNILDKLNVKEYLLRNILEKAGFDRNIKIEKLVLFTNIHNTLRNECEYLKNCNCGQLPYLIDRLGEQVIYTATDIEKIIYTINQSHEKRKYELDFDFREYRYLFAEALALTENVEINDIDMYEIEDIKAYSDDTKCTADGEDNTDDLDVEETESYLGCGWRKVAFYAALTCGCALLSTVGLKKYIL